MWYSTVIYAIQTNRYASFMSTFTFKDIKDMTFCVKIRLLAFSSNILIGLNPAEPDPELFDGDLGI